VFLVLMVIGLVGLVMMALPAFASHGAAHGGHPMQGHGTHHGLGFGRGGARGHLLGPPRGAGGRGVETAPFAPSVPVTPADATVPPDVAPTRLMRFIPSPRAVCSVLALYGAFGNALVHAFHLPFAFAALAAIVPALGVEWFVVRPVWNLIFRFQGQESSPLEELVLAEARAVVPFRNGRGLISTVRDGRVVQLSARLVDAEIAEAIKVGDRLRIEDVDSRRERVLVSVVRD
jgi:hypothetical protein